MKNETQEQIGGEFGDIGYNRHPRTQDIDDVSSFKKGQVGGGDQGRLGGGSVCAVGIQTRRRSALRPHWRGDDEEGITCGCCVTRKHQVKGNQCRRSRVRVWPTGIDDAKTDFCRKRLKRHNGQCNINTNRAHAACRTIRERRVSCPMVSFCTSTRRYALSWNITPPRGGGHVVSRAPSFSEELLAVLLSSTTCPPAQL